MALNGVSHVAVECLKQVAAEECQDLQMILCEETVDLCVGEIAVEAVLQECADQILGSGEPEITEEQQDEHYE